MPPVRCTCAGAPRDDGQHSTSPQVPSTPSQSAQSKSTSTALPATSANSAPDQFLESSPPLPAKTMAKMASMPTEMQIAILEKVQDPIKYLKLMKIDGLRDQTKEAMKHLSFTVWDDHLFNDATWNDAATDDTLEAAFGKGYDRIYHFLAYLASEDEVSKEFKKMLATRVESLELRIASEFKPNLLSPNNWRWKDIEVTSGAEKHKLVQLWNILIRRVFSLVKQVRSVHVDVFSEFEEPCIGFFDAYCDEARQYFRFPLPGAGKIHQLSLRCVPEDTTDWTLPGMVLNSPDGTKHPWLHNLHLDGLVVFFNPDVLRSTTHLAIKSDFEPWWQGNDYNYDTFHRTDHLEKFTALEEVEYTLPHISGAYSACNVMDQLQASTNTLRALTFHISNERQWSGVKSSEDDNWSDQGIPQWPTPQKESKKDPNIAPFPKLEKLVLPATHFFLTFDLKMRDKSGRDLSTAPNMKHLPGFRFAPMPSVKKVCLSINRIRDTREFSRYLRMFIYYILREKMFPGLDKLCLVVDRDTLAHTRKIDRMDWRCTVRCLRQLVASNSAAIILEEQEDIELARKGTDRWFELKHQPNDLTIEKQVSVFDLEKLDFSDISQYLAEVDRLMVLKKLRSNGRFDGAVSQPRRP